MTDPLPAPPARRVPVATLALIGLNVAAFVVVDVATGYQLDAEHLLRWGGDLGVLTLSGEWWRALTALFLHGGVLHLGSNMLCLAFLGPPAERILGSWRFLALYLLSGLVGSVVSEAAIPQVVGVGASGAVFGVAGGLLPLLIARDPGPVWAGGPPSRDLVMRVLKFVLYNLLYSFAPGVDIWAHFGGLAGGVAMGFALRSPLGASPPCRRAALAMLGISVFLICAAWGARRIHSGLLDVGAADTPLVAAVDERRDLKRQTPALERQLEAEPESAQAYITLSNAYAITGRPADALRILQQGVTRVGRRFDLLTALGSIDQNLSRFDDAAAAFEQAREAEPQNPEGRYNLAAALMSRGGREVQGGARDSALADFARVLDLAADSEFDLEARRQIQLLGGR